MKAALTIGAVCWMLMGTAAAQPPCCGDCAGDGRVSIDDLIRAVNNALDDCAGATPTSGTPPTATRTPPPTRQPTATRKPTATATPPPRCPSTFRTSGNNLCLFNGTYNRGCGSALDSTISSDGRVLIVTIATNLVDPPTVRFRADVTDDTNAALTAWSSDNFQTVRITSGSVQLTGGGEGLVVFPDDPPFMIRGCNFVQYLGAYVAPGRAGNAAPAAAPIPELARSPQ
jgi:hypothetical protein